MSGHARSRISRPLRGSWRPTNRMRCSRFPGVGLVGGQRPVRDDLPLAGDPGCNRCARGLRHGDAVVDPLHEEAPERQADLHPPERPGGVPGGDDRTLREGERGDADRRSHRLVQVEDVEAFLLEHTADARHRRRAEDDVGQAVVRGHDHRAADGNDVGRRLPVPPEPRMQDAREAPRRVIAHDRSGLDPELAERLCLQLGVLDHGSPERPGVRDDDPDLHGPEDTAGYAGIDCSKRKTSSGSYFALDLDEAVEIFGVIRLLSSPRASSR